MHNKTCHCLALAVSWTLVHLAAGQDNYQIPDLNPSRLGNGADVSIPASDQNDLPTSPLQINELRRSSLPNTLPSTTSLSDTQDSLSRQPLPPQPNRFRQNSGNPSQNHQDPIQMLDPNRLAPMNRTFAQPNLENNARESSPAVRDMHQLEPSKAPLSNDSTTRIPSSVLNTPQLKPVNFNNPVVSTPQQNQSGGIDQPQSAKVLLQRYDVESNNRPLPGMPVSLQTLMQTTPLKYRIAMVQQYWETYFDWATLQNRLMYSNWLNQIAAPRLPAEQAILATAKSMAKDDVTAAEIQLSKSQVKLQQLSRNRTQDLLPLPLNQPLVSKYNTHYDWYASRNMIPTKLKGINEMLPRTYQLISQRASTVSSAESSKDQAKREFQAGRIPIANLLEAGRTWRSSMQGFVGTIVSYNHAISDYALTITPPNKNLDQVVAMLVAKPKSINEVAQRNSVLDRRNAQPSGLQLPRGGIQQPRFNDSVVRNPGSSERSANNSNSNRTANAAFANPNNDSVRASQRQLRPEPQQKSDLPKITPANRQFGQQTPSANTDPAVPVDKSFNLTPQPKNAVQNPIPGNGANKNKPPIKQGGGFATSQNNNSFSGNGGGAFGSK